MPLAHAVSLTAAATFVVAAAVVVGPVDQAAAPSPVDSRVQLPPVTGHQPELLKPPAAASRAVVRAVVVPEPKAVPLKAPEARRKPLKAAPIRITRYRDCTGDPQPCIDQGRGLTLYGRDVGANILAAHNYHGYQWLSRVAEGRTVVVTSGSVAGTYQVTGHLRLNRQSGNIPSFGGADLVLQSCEGAGTGFSLLRRVS